MNYWPLLGVVVIVIGFALRFNAIPVVVCAALVSGLLAGLHPLDLLALLGRSFVSSRVLLLFVLTLPAIGLLEHAGLREHAQQWMGRLRGLTLARLLIGYLLVREGLAMLGLTGVAGAAQTVRPLLAPMAEAAAEKIHPHLSDTDRDEVRAVAAATDNIGRFFGEDVFIALGAVLLIQGFYAQHGIELTPLSIALWALPTAIAAFGIQSLRIWLFQRRLVRRARAA
ncbi:DUF969 domain-containing protein [Dyella nitratireducens]|uniref:Membrane protein n=1 Tax=Dyella nitratireducens TaxID=1849580 RepID=A0ABQ1G907_9GAMM|nr:DUF969 domain-containing protein [Dyella nitratireducens]GGA39043.1 membrane protein [Dyella nitratireducens]GLQ40395.1 membrane protein [Dyella nitratireducens]